jgi:hypothetical protein
MKCYRELSLEDMLADPIIQAVIDADGVDAMNWTQCCAGSRTNGGPLSAWLRPPGGDDGEGHNGHQIPPNISKPTITSL